MHNRNFIINMVIKGEKSPAFSASTLTLPPASVDNSSRMIENTRRNYSRSRADVEKAINDALQVQNTPAGQPQNKPPQSATQAKQWPINAQTQTVTPQQPNRPRIIREDTPHATPNAPAASASTNATQPQPVATNPDGTPVKKKRTRTRKRKPATSAATNTAANASAPSSDAKPAPKPTPTPKTDETVLKIR
jgi:hypothetical protein